MHLCVLSTAARTYARRARLLLTIATAFALTLSVLHLGRPGVCVAGAKDVAALLAQPRSSALWALLLLLSVLAGRLGDRLVDVHSNSSDTEGAVLATGVRSLHALGVAGTLASAYIYLVPARPSWNMLPHSAGFPV